MRRRACERVANESASIARTHTGCWWRHGLFEYLSLNVILLRVSIEVVSSEQSGLELKSPHTVAQRGNGMKFNWHVLF